MQKLFVKQKSSLAFTLIELLVVIAVLGVLAAGVLVAINPLKRINQANDARIKSDIGQITNAMQAYYVTHQYYPATVGELVTSGDLKTEPKPPSGSYTDYMTTTAQDCIIGDTTTSPKCTEVSIAVPLDAPQATGGKYTWNSTIGQAGEIEPTPTPTAAPTATLTPTPNPLVGYWNIEEGTGTTTRDSINNQNGSLQNGASWSSDHINKNSTKSLSFNGTTANIQIPSSTTLNPASISISFWAKATIVTTGPAQYQRIVSKPSQYEVILFQGYSSGFAGRLQFKILGGTVDIADTAGGVFPSNQWNHIVATYDSITSTGKLYVNANMKASGTTTPIPRSLTTTGGTLKIGSGDGNYFFNGLIDKVRIYNTAIDQNTINLLYSEGS